MLRVISGIAIVYATITTAIVTTWIVKFLMIAFTRGDGTNGGFPIITF